MECKINFVRILVTEEFNDEIHSTEDNPTKTFVDFLFLFSSFCRR